MTFVHVANGRAQVERVQCTDAADPHQNFLTNAGATVATIQAVGQVAVFFQRVIRDVTIQQVERDTSDLHLPDLRVKLAPWHGHADFDGVAIAITLQSDG